MRYRGEIFVYSSVSLSPPSETVGPLRDVMDGLSDESLVEPLSKSCLTNKINYDKSVLLKVQTSRESLHAGLDESSKY